MDLLPDSFNFRLPEIYQIEATNDCNMNCPNCIRQKMKRKVGYLDIDLIDIIADQNGFENSYYVELQMYGEPLLHPNLSEIIDKLKKYVKVGLSTNGLLIESSIDTILKLDYMTISIDSYNLYSRYRSNHLPKFLDDIDLIFSYNRHPFIDIQTINFQEKDNVESMRILQKIADSRDWNEYLIRSVDDCSICFRNDIPADRTELCVNPWISVSIQWDGDVVPCCFSYDKDIIYGNLYEDSLYNIWMSDNVLELRKQHENKSYNSLCNKCYMRSPVLLHMKMLMNWMKEGRIE